MKIDVHNKIEKYKAITESDSQYFLECQDHGSGHLTCMISSKKDGGVFQVVAFTNNQPIHEYIMRIHLTFLSRKDLALGKHICGRNKEGKTICTSEIIVLAKKTGWLKWTKVKSAE